MELLDGALPRGALYHRVIDRLIAPDTRAHAARLGARALSSAHHPWFPVLAIGLEKIDLYAVAMRSDLEGNTRLLSDPAWLARVGRYLELLTGLGIAGAVRAEGFELLSPEERGLVEASTELSAVRAAIDVPAWRAVWRERAMAAPFAGLPAGGPSGVANLLHKQRAGLAFLEAHHADLRVAIALAGPDRGGGPRTWRRVFQDAERAVMRTTARAFPELAALPGAWRELALWRQCGELGNLGRVPRWLAERLGDQDGLFVQASRSYRRSMNEVARWARTRGLMSFAGVECVPPEASLVETMLAERATTGTRAAA